MKRFTLRKIINRFANAKNFILGKSSLNTYPNEINIEPTNKCNMKCKLCAHHNLTRATCDMDFTKFCNITDEVKDHTDAFKFIGIGEPLLHPNIAEMIEYAHSKGITTYLTTNGLKLTPEMSEKIINAGLDELCVSIDGLKPSYTAIRGEGVYDKVVDNVMIFLKIRKSQKPHININMIAEKHNYQEAEEFRVFWENKVDRVTIKKIHNFGGNVGGRYPNDNSGPAKYRRRNICQTPWFSVLLLAEGEVAPCCGDINGTLSYGNAFEKSLREVWNSKKAQAVRKFHKARNFNNESVCSICNMGDVPTVKGNIFEKVYRYFFSNKNLQGPSSFNQ